MWENVIYTKAQAKYKFQEIEAEPENSVPKNIKESFKQLREVIVNEKQQFLLNDMNKINSYSFDLNIGLVLYRVLKEDYDFNERLAAQDEIWRYLSLEVLPDLVYARYGKNDQRFYKNPRRIWLKSIWWYIHLSWQGSDEETFKIIKDNSSDVILQLVDRSGSGGYRVDVTREIIRQLEAVGNNHSHRLHRRILKLNTARLKVLEPSLVEGGVEAYVKDLYDYFLK